MLLEIFQWLGHSALGVFMQQSTYAFAIVEMVHLLALTILGGAILIINLNLLGVGMKSQSAGQLARELKPWLVASLGTAAVSGVMLLAEEPLKCYYSPAFQAKMVSLALAILFYFFIQERLLLKAGKGFRAKLIGVISLLLWFTVGLSGRAIGFL